jgi:dihydroanticapsin dehydrogenase
MRLRNKVAIVTGGAQGIGRGIARAFAREGARVLITDVTDEAGARTVGEIGEAGGIAHYLRSDITVPEDLEQMVREAVARYGRLDILVNNAMVSARGSLLDMTPEEFDRTIIGIPRANFLACKFAVPEMIKGGGGSIIFISSIHGLLAEGENLALYGVGKASILMLMKQIAVRYGPQGIRANAICPGAVRSRAEDDEPDPETPTDLYYRVAYPLRRFGRPRDIANAALFFASDESSWVTGQVLAVDGGLTVQVQDGLALRLARYVKEHPESVKEII